MAGTKVLNSLTRDRNKETTEQQQPADKGGSRTMLIKYTKTQVNTIITNYM